MQLEAWDCTLKTLVVEGAHPNRGLAGAAGGCKSLEDVALIGCGAGRNASIFFDNLAATGADRCAHQGPSPDARRGKLL